MSCNGKADPDCCIALDGEDKPTAGTYHNSTSKQSIHISIVSNHLRHNGDGSSTFAPTTNLWTELMNSRRGACLTRSLFQGLRQIPKYMSVPTQGPCVLMTNEGCILAYEHIYSRSYNPRLPRPASCTSLPPRKPNTIWSNNHFLHNLQEKRRTVEAIVERHIYNRGVQFPRTPYYASPIVRGSIPWYKATFTRYQW